jgi:hypothetical protein
MLPQPLRHRFTIDGELYCLEEYTRGGERRIQQQYAMSLSLTGTTPAVMQTLDGDNLYLEAVARECLREAPAIFWEDLSSTGAQNGATMRGVTFEQVPHSLWVRFAKEVEAFLASLFQRTRQDLAPVDTGRPAESTRLADAQNLSPVFTGAAR